MPFLENIAKQISKQKYPPVHLWEPKFCGEIDIRISSDGTWFYLGSPIGRKAMVKLFSSVLRYDEDKEYYLVTPAEKLRIKVDLAPLIVVEMIVEGLGKEQNIIFRTLTEDIVTLDQEHPLTIFNNVETNEPCPKVRIRGNLEALINRPVFYELAARSVIDEKGELNMFGVWSSSQFFPLGRVEE